MATAAISCSLPAYAQRIPCRLVRAPAPARLIGAWQRQRLYSSRAWPGSFACDAAPALDEHGHIPSAPYDAEPLTGTLPHTDAHLVLHPAQYSRPPTTWPSHVESSCALLSELASRTREHGSLAGFRVNLSSGDAALAEPPSGAWDPSRSTAMRMPPNHAQEDEMFWLYAYTTSGRYVRWPEPISLRTLPSGTELRTQLQAMWSRAHDTLESHIYVCTHGMRDCRCGVAGTAVYDALQRAVTNHTAQCAQDGAKPARTIRVFPINHVGGHKWAACALVYPHGDWYGNLRVSDVPLLLRTALAPSSSRHDLDDLRERLVVWPRWRGRLGMSQSEQRDHRDVWGPPIVHTAHITPARRSRSHSRSPTPSPPAAVDTRTTVPLRFHAHDGTWYNVDGHIGESLMEVAKRHNLPSIEATCGGELECATCHAYLCDASDGSDPATRGDINRAPSWSAAAVSDEEDDMLEYAPFRKASSRLTCQVRVSQALSDWMQRGGRIELDRF